MAVAGYAATAQPRMRVKMEAACVSRAAAESNAATTVVAVPVATAGRTKCAAAGCVCVRRAARASSAATTVAGALAGRVRRRPIAAATTSASPIWNERSLSERGWAGLGCRLVYQARGGVSLRTDCVRESPRSPLAPRGARPWRANTAHIHVVRYRLARWLNDTDRLDSFGYSSSSVGRRSCGMRASSCLLA